MHSERNKILVLPYQITEYVFCNKLHRPFSIFLYLKMFVGDKVSAKDSIFIQLRNDLKMSDPKGRTFRKHFQKLLELNWVGYNVESDTYHIRSFDYIRAVNDFKKRRATKLFLRDILQLQVYLAAVLICTRIQGQKYYWEKVKGKPRTATINKGVAKQSRAFRHSTQPPYYGLCNRTIARLLGCKYTRACELKLAAAKAGYFTVRHRYADIMELNKADFLLRPMLAEFIPTLAKRYRFWRQMKDGAKIIKVVRQLHDEIIPHIAYKRVTGFSKLKVPFGIIEGFLPTPQAKAA